MIGDIISSVLNFLLEIIMTIVQIVCLPINALFGSVFPDFSSKINQIDQAFDAVFKNLTWAISFIPPSVRSTMLFIFTIELAMLVVMRSTHMTAKLWSILQKLKFW